MEQYEITTMCNKMR